VEAIYLFGSRARHDNRKRSDIDIAINCPSASDKDWNQILDIIESADTLLKIDCVRLDQLSDANSLKANILQESKTIYKKHEG
jgi:predicted nucleotidyltransferase